MEVRRWTQLCALAIVLTAVLEAGSLRRQDPEPPQIQLAREGETAWDVLPQMLNITYQAGPEVPTCGRSLQDSNGGIIHNTLISVAGFGIPAECPESEKKYIKKVYGLDLANPLAGWRELPDLPGARRQSHAAIAVGEELCLWGGFSYFDPYTYKDGFRLSRRNASWEWAPMPDLPWAAAGAGICAIGSKIYHFGGMDYDHKRMHTNADRGGNDPGLGSRLLVLDLKDLDSGWKELPPCPGTARWYPAVSAAGGKVYVLGGVSGNDNATGQYCTVVDNWRYDPAREQWERLADLPIASGNFPTGEIVYDTVTGVFGRGDPLPLNNNMPATVVRGNRIHMFGTETHEAVVEGRSYTHRPNLYLVGTITPVAEADWREQLKFMK